MATTITRWYDGGNFAFAYAVYNDQAMTVPSLDGWYSFGGYVREQRNGKLTSYASC